MKISGYTCIRNGVELDYCFMLTITSLLNVCDEVVVGYKESTDDTLYELEAYSNLVDDRVRIIHQPWDSPKGDVTWWTRWINETREHLKYPVQLMLDADEVLDCNPACLDRIRKVAASGRSAWFHRLNFIRDAYHLIPSGHCIGDKVVRLGPSQWWMPSDEPHPEGEPIIRTNGSLFPELKIFHYGFLRRTSVLYEKFENNSQIWFGTSETRLDEQRKACSEEWYKIVPWGHQLVDYLERRHPSIAMDWLRERGRL